MAEARDLRRSGERIERLLEEIRASASPPCWRRVEELVRLVVELYGAGLARIVEIVGAAARDPEGGAAAISARLAADELVASLLLVHGLHPDDVPTRLRSALARVRPYLGSHGGDVEVVELDERAGAVLLRMTGSCDGCPSSAMTVRLAVESAIHELVPEIGQIEVEGVTAHGNGHGAAPARREAAYAATESAGSWVRIDREAVPRSPALASREVTGERIVLCRLDETLYAYRDGCAACGSALAQGTLDGSLLGCPACGQRFDVRLAGRALERPDVHLVPLPLLEDESGVRIALGEAHA
jgi:Fe-S cluster biogenesis protein NfuA/nitrite reductase/ring-hydroxylating ferredoxin subunit